MLVRDMLGLAVSALRQQKVRTVLTTLGVVFGSLVLTASLSVGLGVQRAIQTLASDFLREVQVYPDWEGKEVGLKEKGAMQVEGKMSEARRERLRQALAGRKARLSGRAPGVLSQEKVAALTALKHVQLAMPLAWQAGYAFWKGETQSTDIGAARPDDAGWHKRLVAGRFFIAADERAAVVSETLLYLFGVTDEAAMGDVLGKRLRLEFRRGRAGLGVHIFNPLSGETSLQEAAVLAKVAQQLPQAIEKLDLAKEEKELLRKAVQTQPADAGGLYAQEYTIVGVVRPGTREDERWWWGGLQDGDVVLPFQTAADLFFRVYGRTGAGMNRAVLMVDREENVEAVVSQVRELGFHSFAPLEEIKRQRLIYLLIFSGEACVAIVALVVAGLGIANTMLISVLERTREIGIMKAVGADNRHLQVIFLVEGAIIGCVGAGLGLLLAWGASFPGNAWLASMVTRDLKLDLKESIFAFPAWLPPAVFCFAVAITVLAAVYPSRRAARVDPVTALRHE